MLLFCLHLKNNNNKKKLDLLSCGLGLRLFNEPQALGLVSAPGRAGRPSEAVGDKKGSLCCFGTGLGEVVEIVYEISIFFERNLNIF